MQNMPCEVRAYLRFSIFRLQFRHRKHVAQKAWSPVKIARSSILLPQALQLYVQLLQMREPSPRRRRFASESSSVPQVLHRKQLRCHRLPAKMVVRSVAPRSWNTHSIISGYTRANAEATRNIARGMFYLPSSNALPSSRICRIVSANCLDPHVDPTYVAASFARICYIIPIHRRVQVIGRRFHLEPRPVPSMRTW